MNEADEDVSAKLHQIRVICLALPEANERASHGAPTFFVRDKRPFVMFMNHHHDDGRLALWCAAPADAQVAMVAQDPVHYFVPPYVGHRGWIGVRLDRQLDWNEVTEVVHDAYRAVAPRALSAQLDQERPA